MQFLGNDPVVRLYCWFPSVLGAIAILRPETIIRWHRSGFRSYWRGRSRSRVGKPYCGIRFNSACTERNIADVFEQLSTAERSRPIASMRSARSNKR
jgi:hypothetical protein